jgi:hypothetical protein
VTNAVPPLRRRLAWWGGLLVLFLCGAATLVVVALSLLSDPAFASVDELDNARVKGITFFVLNRPDGSPDIGRVQQPVTVPADQIPAVLDLFRKATPVETLPPKVWLGKLVVELTDGRSETIMLYWSNADREAKRPLRVRFKIRTRQFEGGEVEVLVKKLLAISEAN